MRTSSSVTTPGRRHPRPDRVQSVQRALAILETFTHELPELGITDITRRVGLTKGVVFRVVQTLVESGFLERADHNGTYRIGLRAFEVGSRYQVGATLERAALDPMRQLADKQTHNVYLGVHDGRYAVYVLTVEGKGPIKVHAAIGSRVYAHASAMGKVFLASLAPADAHELLTQELLIGLTPNTITNVSRLERQLEEIRRSGYATNRGETFFGVGSVAAPIHDRSGAVVAAVSNGFPLVTDSRTDWKQLAADVVACADEISQRLGSTRN
jgi:IclR family transcriptional regulator, KDG regulon repressor